MNDRRPRRNFAPVNTGDEVDLRIEAVGAKGDGIGKVQGFVVFVPGAKEGEDVKVRITKVFRNQAFGEIVGDSQGETEQTAQEEQTEETDQKEQTEETDQEEQAEETDQEAFDPEEEESEATLPGEEDTEEDTGEEENKEE